MPTGLLTRGFATAPDVHEYVGPVKKPDPPPPTENQPFGYRFRVVPSITKKLTGLKYDDELQLNRMNGEIFASGGGGTTTITYETYPETWVDGFYIIDPITDKHTGVGY